MKNLKFLSTAPYFIVFLLIISCKEQSDLLPQSYSSKSDLNSARISSRENIDGEYVLGEKLQNPYSVKNMSDALKLIVATNSDFKNVKVVNNYNYVRIESLTEESNLEIVGSGDLDLYIYPLDYKILKTGRSYSEKDKKALFQVYWAAVPVDYVFPKGLEVTVLEKLYLPFGNGKQEVNLSDGEKGKLEFLEEKSLELTNNVDKSNKKSKISNNTPSGSITVWDQTLNKFLAVEGVTVRAKRWFTSRYGVTNNIGFYSISFTFNGQVDYDILWEASEFDVRSGTWGQATTGQNNINGSWSPQIMPSAGIIPFAGILSNESFGYAHAFRAAFVYYYKNSTWGIKTPPKHQSTILGGNNKIKIGVVNNSATSNYFDVNGAFYGSQVKINFESNSLELNGRYIFGTTIHELAHASHWELGFTSVEWLTNNNKKRFSEAWAIGVEYKITNDVYQSLSFVPPLINNYVYNYQSNQNYTLAQIPNQVTYFPLFVDLMDNLNQSSIQTSYPNDLVSGFTLSRLELNLANNPSNWDGMRNACVQLQNFGVQGGTQANIYYIFDNYK